jgi:lipopolysaccharide/colanic/teichoic acid biosynthesis glycosyltransferase
LLSDQLSTTVIVLLVIWAVLGFIGRVLASGLGRVAGEDLRTSAPRIAEHLLRAAAKRLHPSCADRYLEEWLADLEQKPETLWKLWYALHIRYVGARRMAREVGTHPRFSGTNSRVIRALDLAISGSILLAGLPVFVVVAAVCLFQDGRALTITKSVGRGGKAIRVYRFPLPQTRFGRFLWRYTLDELPMLWNILKGDMTLVGPRLLISDAERDAASYRRQEVRPGLTGFAQLLPPGSGASRFDTDDSYLTTFTTRHYFRVLLVTFTLGLKSINRKSHHWWLRWR